MLSKAFKNLALRNEIGFHFSWADLHVVALGYVKELLVSAGDLSPWLMQINKSKDLFVLVHLVHLKQTV
jgi:hypothetical protein